MPLTKAWCEITSTKLVIPLATASGVWLADKLFVPTRIMRSWSFLGTPCSPSCERWHFDFITANLNIQIWWKYFIKNITEAFPPLKFLTIKSPLNTDGKLVYSGFASAFELFKLWPPLHHWSLNKRSLSGKSDIIQKWNPNHKCKQTILAIIPVQVHGAFVLAFQLFKLWPPLRCSLNNLR